MSVQTANCERCGIRRQVHHKRLTTGLCRDCWDVEPTWPQIPAEPSRCGTQAGYQLHRRRKEVPCDECTFAHSDTTRRRRYRRRAEAA